MQPGISCLGHRLTVVRDSFLVCRSNRRLIAGIDVSAVMVSPPFAGHEESPAATVEVDARLYKEYCGSASGFNKGEYKHVEGKRNFEPVKGLLRETLREMRADLQGRFSCAGRRVLMNKNKVSVALTPRVGDPAPKTADQDGVR